MTCEAHPAPDLHDHIADLLDAHPAWTFEQVAEELHRRGVLASVIDVAWVFARTL